MRQRRDRRVVALLMITVALIVAAVLTGRFGTTNVTASRHDFVLRALQPSDAQDVMPTARDLSVTFIGDTVAVRTHRDGVPVEELVIDDWLNQPADWFDELIPMLQPFGITGEAAATCAADLRQQLREMAERHRNSGSDSLRLFRSTGFMERLVHRDRLLLIWTVATVVIVSLWWCGVRRNSWARSRTGHADPTRD